MFLFGTHFPLFGHKGFITKAQSTSGTLDVFARHPPRQTHPRKAFAAFGSQSMQPLESKAFSAPKPFKAF